MTAGKKILRLSFGIGYVPHPCIYNMTDREMRAYKWRLRRERARRVRIVKFILGICLMAALIVSYHAIRSSAHAGEEELKFKYYTTVTVPYGESLWSIADHYIDYSRYADKGAYISEVCSINHLDENGNVRAGQRIIVPYYSCE